MHNYPVIADELDMLAGLVPLDNAQLIELGCGAAGVGRKLLARFPGARLTGLEVDERQHTKNLAEPAERLTFLAGGAQAIPLPDAQFDGALMLKSLHHVPLADMARALNEVARVLRPGGWLYVSEPVYDGALNEVVKLYNDEGVVRAAAQAALDAAVAGGHWRTEGEHRFATAVRYRDFDEFEQRMMRPTYADHRLTEAKIAAVRERYLPHQTAAGAHFTRPMHVRLLRKLA